MIRSPSPVRCFLLSFLLFDTPFFVTAVCTGLNLSTEFCCGGKIFPFDDGICCANTFHDFSRYGCCGGKPDSFNCCGPTGQQYELQQQGCCGSHIFNLTTHGCCGDKNPMDLGTEGCCPDGGVYSYLTGGCCNGVTYDKKKGQLCNDDGTIRVVPVPPPTPTRPPISASIPITKRSSTDFLFDTIPVPFFLPVVWTLAYVWYECMNYYRSCSSPSPYSSPEFVLSQLPILWLFIATTDLPIVLSCTKSSRITKSRP